MCVSVCINSIQRLVVNKEYFNNDITREVISILMKNFRKELASVANRTVIYNSNLLLDVDFIIEIYINQQQ